MEQVIPHNKRKFNQIFMVKREKADWRKAFKKEWKEASTQTKNSNTYLTDTNNWICACPVFLTSRFFICKHLVLQKGTVNASFLMKFIVIISILLLVLHQFKLLILNNLLHTLYKQHQVLKL